MRQLDRRQRTNGCSTVLGLLPVSSRCYFYQIAHTTILFVRTQSVLIHSFTHQLYLHSRPIFRTDSRCVDFFHFTKAKAFNESKTPLFADRVFNEEYIQTNLQSSFALPIVNKGEFLGVNMGRVEMNDILSVLTEERTPTGPGGFHAMILAGERATTQDLLIAPGFQFGGESAAFASAMLPHDSCDGADLFENTNACQNLRDFVTIVDEMHSGESDMVTFRRTKDESGTQEKVTFAFAPVSPMSFRPIDPSNFSRGVRQYTAPIFSVALGQTEEGIAQAFVSVQEALDGTMSRSVLSAAMVALAAMVLLFPVTAYISMSIVRPVTQLCKLVSNVNQNETTADFPHFVGGSSEVSKVRSTFERLYKVVRVGNMAFFMGELDKAYSILQDALSLFRMLQNKKAIGIANNNLGVLMLTIYRTMKKTNTPTLCCFSRKKVIHKANEYFAAAIDLGEEALRTINHEEGFSVNYLIFMQQLSNRYFNRAIFLLTSRQDHPSPEKAKEQGLLDLITCKDMDREVVDNGDQEGFKGDKDVYFELLMSRIKGLLLLMKMGYEDPWGIDELFDEARMELTSALDTPDHPLFDHLAQAGQIQRLDGALIDYHLFMASRRKTDEQKRRHVMMGAEIATRMMIEDDYVIADSAMLALKALVDATHISDDERLDDYGGMDVSDVRSALFQYRHQIGEVLSLSYATKSLLDREAFNASNVGDFNLEVF